MAAVETAAGGASLTVIFVALLGPMAGPYVLIVFAAVAGAMWPPTFHRRLPKSPRSPCAQPSIDMPRPFRLTSTAQRRPPGTTTSIPPSATRMNLPSHVSRSKAAPSVPGAPLCGLLPTPSAPKSKPAAALFQVPTS